MICVFDRNLKYLLRWLHSYPLLCWRGRSFYLLILCLFLSFFLGWWKRDRKVYYKTTTNRPSAAPIPCLPPAPSRPFVMLKLPTSSANERLLAPTACGEVPSRLGGWRRAADRGVHAGPLWVAGLLAGLLAQQQFLKCRLTQARMGCMPILAWFHRVGQSRPRPLKPDASRAIHRQRVASRVRQGSQRWPFSASRAWCAARLASARPSRSSALRHSAPLAEVISTRWSPAARMRACTQARCFSPYIPAFLCPVHARESLAAPNLEYDYLTRKTGRMWPLWIVWQRDADTAAGELERYSAPKDLAVQRGCSHADMYIYLCLFVFTLVLLHMKWHIFGYVLTPDRSSNHIYIRIYS